MWKSRGSGKNIASVDDVLKEVLGREIPGLIEFKPVSEVLCFVFLLEFRRRFSGFDGEWVCVKVDSGGYSAIYRCCQGSRCVVLKVPRSFESFVEARAKGLTPLELKISDERARALLKELEYTSTLNHPHLIKPIAHHVDNRSLFLVYEYAIHGSLKY